MRKGRAVCPLRSAEPVYFSHFLLAVNEPGEIVERCACGFERRIAWGNVAVEVVEREAAALEADPRPGTRVRMFALVDVSLGLRTFDSAERSGRLRRIWADWREKQGQGG
jgi:hypothetical protein